MTADRRKDVAFGIIDDSSKLVVVVVIRIVGRGSEKKYDGFLNIGYHAYLAPAGLAIHFFLLLLLLLLLCLFSLLAATLTVIVSYWCFFRGRPNARVDPCS